MRGLESRTICPWQAFVGRRRNRIVGAELDTRVHSDSLRRFRTHRPCCGHLVCRLGNKKQRRIGLQIGRFGADNPVVHGTHRFFSCICVLPPRDDWTSPYRSMYRNGIFGMAKSCLSPIKSGFTLRASGWQKYLKPLGFYARCGARSVLIAAEWFWLRKSATIHAAPVIARFCALPTQLNILSGSTKGAGSHTNNPKPMSIAVSKRDARRAERPESRAMAASANAIVVVIAQNICPRGIHFGTNDAVPER